MCRMEEADGCTAAAGGAAGGAAAHGGGAAARRGWERTMFHDVSLALGLHLLH